MGVPKEKKYYMGRGKGGKEQKYDSAEKLLSMAFEYFAWCEDNPWHKKELMRSGDRKGEIIEVPVCRPYTLTGLCVYCGIGEATFAKYEQDERFKDATIHLIDIIRQNYLEGAIIGAYNSSFVSRLLDLTEGNEGINSDNQPFVINVTDNETKEEIERLRLNMANG